MTTRQVRNTLALVVGLLLGAFVTLASAAPVWPKVTVKSTTTGVPVWVGDITGGVGSATGTGGLFSGTGRINLGTTGANLAATRSLTWAGFGTALRSVSMVAGYTLAVPLAIEGISWAIDHWQTEETVVPPGEFGDLLYRNANPSGGTTWAGPPVVTYAHTTPASACAAMYAGYHMVHTGGYRWTQGEPSTLLSVFPASKPGDCEVQSTDPPYNKTFMQNWLYGFRTPSYTPPDPTVRPSTLAEIEQALANAVMTCPSCVPGLLSELATRFPASLAAVMTSLQLAGPATVVAPAKVTTTVTDAGTTTKTETTTYRLSYPPGGGTVLVGADTVTDTHTPDDKHAIETVTTPIPSDTDTPPKEPAEEVPDLCVEHPDASGCAPFGEPAENLELATDNVPVSGLASEMSAAGSCPAGIPLSFMGTQAMFEFTGACEFANGVRPVVLALAWLSAVWFVFSVGSKAQTS